MAKRLFQIYITDSDVSGLPDRLEQLSQELIYSFQGYEYSLWGNKSIRDFLSENFTSEVLQAYDCLAPYAYRSDLARYCLLYQYGGWYVDLGIKFAGNYVVSSVDQNLEMIYFWDLGDLLAPYRSFYDCMNGIIYSSPNNPILKTAIDLVIDNCRNQFYGSDSMSPTGPGVLGRAIAIHGKTDKHYDGHFLQLTPQHTQKNRAYILRDGTIMAWHRSRIDPNGSTLEDLGAKGTNDYRTLWHERKVFLNQF